MKHFLTALFFVGILCVSLYAQKTVVDVPDYWDTQTEGTLNDAVQAAIDGSTLSNTIFKLKPYGTYVLTGSIITPPGQVLEIAGDEPGNTQETAPPMVCWTANTAPSKTYIFDVAGEIKLKNVWILWASLDGTRYGSTIRVGDSATVSGGRCEFDNVMFDYVSQSSSGAVQPFATHFKGYFKNCYFRNCTDNHFRYYSRAVSVPYLAQGLHIDTLSFENCTFANMGYVYMQEGGVYGDNVFFNHCTFYNVMMYTLESGWWNKMYVANSLFINTFMYGYIPTAPDGINGGTIWISPVDSSDAMGPGFGFVPDWNPRDGVADFTDEERCILFANNNYYLDQWLTDWMGYGTNGSPYSIDKHKNRLDDEIPRPQPMFNDTTNKFFDSTDAQGNKAFPFMNRASLYTLDPGFINPPINLDSLKDFINRKWDDNSDLLWAWDPFYGYLQIWPLVESLSYTNADLKTAAMGGLPLGDLYHWWPAEYASWKAQETSEYRYIHNWLETGSTDTSGGVGVKNLAGSPKEYKLGQNYPNPFNPSTQIEYSIPQKGFVTLKVYNLLGQEVATLFKGMQNAGNYVATFNGAGLASGVYLYKLQSGDAAITKKFTLIK